MKLKWTKSSFSQTDNNCVMWATAADGSFHLGNTRDPNGPKLTFTRGEIEAFVAGVKNDEMLPPAE